MGLLVGFFRAVLAGPKTTAGCGAGQLSDGLDLVAQARRGGRAGRGSPRRACADARGDTLLVELRPLLHIHPHPQNSKRLHLRFHLGRADHPERVK